MTFPEFKENFQKKTVEEISISPPEKPLVSVLVQTYQQKDFIKECLEGILMQETTFDFEILVGEDGSRDGTRDICLKYGENYPEKIRLFLHHRENQIKVLGEATSSFNAFYNFYSAKGKYVAFCEGDDKWTDPLKLQKQVDLLQKNPECVLSFHRFEEKNEKSAKGLAQPVLDQVLQDIPQEDLKRLLYHPLLSTVCFRNKLNELPKEITRVINVDSFFFSLLGNYGNALFQNDIQPGIYRRHSGGLWTGRKKEIKLLAKINTFTHLANYYNNVDDKELCSYFNTSKKNHLRMLFMHHLKNFEVVKASRLLPALT